MTEAEPPDEAEAETAADARPPAWRTALTWGLRLAGTAVGFGYVAWVVSSDETMTALQSALGRISLVAFLAACGATAANLVVGALRWRILLVAYGAPDRPPLSLLVRAYAIGFFYNTYLPGGVGGDLVRGVVTRSSFGDKGGVTASIAVVLVERALGLSGLLLLVSATALVRPVAGTQNVLLYGAVGLSLAAAGVAAVTFGRRLAPHAPRPIAGILQSLPEVERWAPFWGALGLSLGTQSIVAVTGWLLLDSVTGGAVSLGDAFVLVPLGAASAFFPLSVGGAGVREAAFVGLFVTALSMTTGDAVAVSILMWGTQLAVGALGGVVQLLAPVVPRRTDG